MTLGIPRNILIIADIEGSSGCWDRPGGKFMTPQWRRACIGMSRDVGAVAKALLNAGVEAVNVIDFHRTAYNLLPNLIDGRAKISQGYATGPVPGMGRVEGADAVMFIGMHAASGTSGFLSHTLTSRISRLELNGRLVPEVTLFAVVLAPYGIRPLFFSGCPVACRQAVEEIPGICTYAIDKTGGPHQFDEKNWRQGLAQTALAALRNDEARCPDPSGPFNVDIDMQDKAAAETAAKRWGCEFKRGRIQFTVTDASELYLRLIQVCYFNRFTGRFLGPSMFLYRLIGRLGWLTVRLAEKIAREKTN